MSFPRSALLFILGILLIGLAGMQHESLIQKRATLQLQAVPPAETTPLVALTTVAFGGFRGLIADVLWVRAADLQEEGHYFELVQLAKWISQLEPRIPQVWSFQSWNLAYNISVLFPNHEDRWRWVRHGIDLLRNQGLSHNPGSADLCWDIGWMFQHKIGMQFDEANALYRQRLAAEVEALLPDGQLPESAPSDLAAALQQRFRMDLSSMQTLNTTYGPIDWRVPEAHSLYWASVGEPQAKRNFTRNTLRRMRLSSLRALMGKGRLLGEPSREKPIALPRPELIPVLQDLFTTERARTDDPTLERSYQAFLFDALNLRLDLGQVSEAAALYEELAAQSDEVPTGPGAFEAWAQNHLQQDPANLSSDQAMLRVVTLLLRARVYEQSQPAQARGLRSMAGQIHRRFQESRSTPELLARTGLPPFERFQDLLESTPES